jgi:glutamate-ammonia-ligase adenylyltransferase
MFEPLRAWSPLYADLLDNDPGLETWLDREARHDWHRRDFEAEFASMAGECGLTVALRRFRRRASLRIAAREVGNLCDVQRSLLELTLLAEFVLARLLDHLQSSWEVKLGTPWNDALDRPAQFCVLGLGKFGARELNFCSDLDLIYLYEGDGHCRRDGRPVTTTSAEFQARLAQDLTAQLHQRTPDGFLYNIDLRLRPEGESGPIVRSLDAAEHYYYTAGQTWERLALVKARAVAGHVPLEAELFERLNPFRFPRHLPPRLIENIAEVKRRIEGETGNRNTLERHLKSGPGGIREIEFYVQALQMLNAGRNPFLQEPSTLGAIEKLARYEILEPERGHFLREAYLQLRRLENLLQVREEKQTHTLPTDPALVERLRKIGPLDHLDEVRARVRANYLELFPESPPGADTAQWLAFLSGSEPTDSIDSTVRGWFGGDGDAAARVREFVAGESAHVLTREQVELFLGLARHFDTIFPALARPLDVLRRVTTFSRRYGLPRQFLKACHANPRFFEALCRLFDRSSFVFDFLVEHPEIIEEVLGPGFRRDKSSAEHLDEIRRGPEGDGFTPWLALYARAEEVRFMVRELLEESATAGSPARLTRLADAVVTELLERNRLDSRLCVVGLGKFGGESLTFGSDLDVVLAGDGQHPRLVPRFLKQLREVFSVDLRLRPWGDAGALVVTPESFRAYSFAVWERMAWTRARPVAGSAAFANAVMELVDEKVFGAPLTADDVSRIGEIRSLMEREKGQPSVPGEIPFKAGRGGIADIEFLIQRHQIAHGVRGANLRDPFLRLGEIGVIGQQSVTVLLDHLDFFRRVEHAVRRDRHNAAGTLAPDQLHAVGIWIGFSGDLGAELARRMNETRELVRATICVPTFPA